MKKSFFYFGILGFILFEIANVYFIMPMPGSQEMNSLGIAYFLYSGRWIFRGLFLIMAVWGLKSAFSASKWMVLIALSGAAGVFYAANYNMAADAMFVQPRQLNLKYADENKVEPQRIVLGVEYGGRAKAYPIQYLGYHHQVRDTLAGKPIMVTYCTVCRTGRVFEPIVNGRTETFRLVGMDHFNAMFEDATTGSWWRQVTGEAVAGPLKGQMLPEMAATQTSLAQWLELYPNSAVLQPDPAFQVEYDSMSNYEAGRRKGTLTKWDSLSWQNKSWVAGVALGQASKAYDWNKLRELRVIQDVLDNQPIVVLLADDNKSLFAFRRAAAAQQLTLKNDTLFDGTTAYNLLGKPLNAPVSELKRINAYQEYWHSWKTFHPATQQ